MGTTVPSGMVAVVGAAVRLIVCWPNAATAAKTSSTQTAAAAFSVALLLKSLIRIMVHASRCRFVLDITLNSCFALSAGGGSLPVVKGRKHSLPFAGMRLTGFRQSQIPVN